MKAKSNQRPFLPATDITKICLDNFELNFFAIMFTHIFYVIPEYN
jgi:hypothetical protein